MENADSICLEQQYSTTRRVVKKEHIVGNPTEDNSQLVFFLPETKGRKGEGGLRSKGYFKNNFENKPLITIITVIFNGEQFLEETILSVIKQGYDNIEYIIIDGGSTDGTIDILRKYEHVIDYWVSEKDKGIYDAMNKGWSLASEGSRILFLGAGDIIKQLPIAEVLLNRNNYIIYGTTELHDRVFNSTCNWRLKLGNTLHHQSLLIPKQLHKQPPFDLKIKIYADYDFNLRLYKNGGHFIFSSSLRAYALPDGISANLDISEMSAVSRKSYGLFWGGMSKLYCHFQVIKARVFT